MSEEQIEARLESFREGWSQHIESIQSSTHHRQQIETNLTTLLTKINQDWYGPEEVIQTAEESVTEIRASITPRIESAATNSLSDLLDELEVAIEMDQENHEQSPDLQSIFSNHVDADAIEAEVADTDYDYHRIRSSLFAKFAAIARIEEIKALKISNLYQDIRSFVGELNSAGFKRDYREELVDQIENYLREGHTDPPPKAVIPELLGELNSEDWEEDSLDEVIGILESPSEINEFCQVLLGEKYPRHYCIPLPANRISKPHMNVAGVDFYMRGSDDFTYLDDLVEYDERTEEAIEDVTTGTDFFAVLQIVAPTTEVGETRMEQKVERAIDALNFAKDKGVVQNPFTQPQKSYLSRVSDGRWRIYTSNHRKFGLPHGFQVDEDHEEILETRFDFFKNDQSSLTNLENRFIQSYRWYGDGLQSGVKEDELLKYVIAMESMLVPEMSGNKKDVLAQRLADLLGIYDQYRDSFKDGVTGLYDTRNEIVHNADIDIPDVDQKISSAREKATQMFSILIESYIDEMDELGALLDELEALDVPEAPEDHNPYFPD